MVDGERRHEGQTLGMRRVVDRRREEPVPVAVPGGDVVETVTSIGDDAVDVDHCDGTLLPHAVHRATASAPPAPEVLCPL